MKIKYFLIFLLSIPFENICQSQSFYKGADLSYVKELEGCGVQWKENNTVKDIFSIFKDNGANIVRFRLWHTPTVGKNGYADTESMIFRAKAKGLKVILDFHYSDTWADAGKQKCPAAWMGVVNNNPVLADSLYNYTKKTLQTLKDKNLMPEFVQVGNETNGGMCFPGDGTVTWPTDWSKQTLLFNAGIKAVRDVDANTKVILHVADPTNVVWWAGQLNTNNVTGYDILGVSFYPIWHTSKTINDFGIIITNIKNNYSKDVMVVETGLPWTNSWDDNTTNMMNGVPAGYGTTPSPEIQAQWLTDLYNKMVAVGGLGIVYWEPEWVASHTNCPVAYGGSVWENVTLFDFDNNLMTNGGIKFCKLSTGINELNAKPDDRLLNVFPNPAHDELNVEFTAKSADKVLIEIVDLEGKVVKTFTRKTLVGSNKFLLDLSDFNTTDGFYMLRLYANGTINNQSFILSR
jgi:arabinogalactan endo-1,4-beta-galactosidase